MAKHMLLALMGGKILCSCGFNYTETDMNFPKAKIQDRLLDEFLKHQKKAESWDK